MARRENSFMDDSRSFHIDIDLVKTQFLILLPKVLLPKQENIFQFFVWEFLTKQIILNQLFNSW